MIVLLFICCIDTKDEKKQEKKEMSVFYKSEELKDVVDSFLLMIDSVSGSRIYQNILRVTIQETENNSSVLVLVSDFCYANYYDAFLESEFYLVVFYDFDNKLGHRLINIVSNSEIKIDNKFKSEDKAIIDPYSETVRKYSIQLSSNGSYKFVRIK